MTDYLMSCKDKFEKDFCVSLFFDFRLDSAGEIIFSFWCAKGFENVYEQEKKIFNACQYEVNKTGVILTLAKAEVYLRGLTNDK